MSESEKTSEYQSEHTQDGTTRRALYIARQRQEKNKNTRTRLYRKIAKIMMFAAPVLLLGAIIGFSLVRSANRPAPTEVPRIVVDPQEYDFGTISMAAGSVKKTFEIKNTGSADLKIENLRTSCHCTTAALVINGRKSPAFGMDGSVFWSLSITPGQTASLEVVFDPAFHGPSGIGAVTRGVDFTTNDPAERAVQLLLYARVIS